MKKTLQEQYLLIKEGKGHKDVFIKEARSLFPNHIRNAATFKEVSNILKNKQIIKENVVEIGAINQLPAAKKESYELAFEKFLTEEKKKEYFDEEKAELKKPSKQVEDDLSHIYDAKDDKNINNVIFGQVMMGYYAEMKDPKNKDKTADQLKDIVLKNLAKNPTYYTEKGQFGDLDLGYTVDAPGLGEPKEPKGPHKSSGYGTLNEDHEGSCETVHPNESHKAYEAKINEDDVFDKFKNHVKNEFEGTAPIKNMKELESKSKRLGYSSVKEYVSHLLKDFGDATIFKMKESDLYRLATKDNTKKVNESLEETQVRTVVKEIIRQELNENVQKRLKAIEEESQYEVLSTKADKIQQEIEMREARMTRLDEDEDMKDLLDKNKIKNLKKEIKVLQKAANKVNKMLDKVNKKNAKSSEPEEEEKEEIVDEAIDDKKLDDTGKTLDDIKGKIEDIGKSTDEMFEGHEGDELSQYTMEAEEIMAETGDMDEALKTIPEEYKEDVKRHLEPRF